VYIVCFENDDDGMQHGPFEVTKVLTAIECMNICAEMLMELGGWC
jgi:hypothetical protein